MQKTFELTRAALAALDFTAEVAELEAVQSQLAALAEAERKTIARMGEIDAQTREEKINGSKVADRLLAGEDVTEATANSSFQALRDERSVLAETLRELRHRQQDIAPRDNQIRSQARSRAAIEARPAIDALMAEAREAAEMLAKCYAAAHGIAGATGTHSEGRDVLKTAFEGVVTLFHKTGGVPEIEVPQMVHDLMAPLAEKPVLVARVPSHIPGLSRPYAEPLAVESPRKASADDGKHKSWAVPAWAGARASIAIPN